MTTTTHPPLLRGWAALALVLLASASAWADTTLHEALDRAWERAVVARLAESRLGEADASRTAANSWFAEPPSVGLSEKNDRLYDNRGAREHELDITLPLWLPGQRAARETFAQRDEQDAQAGLASARLALAGELRAAVWNLATAKAESEIAAERLATAEKLEADVARRQKAGDLARTDLLLTQEETLAARASTIEAQSRERQALSRLRMLTGLDGMPGAIDETVTVLSAPHHPRLALAQAAVERARSEWKVVTTDRRNPPELSIGVVQTRDAFAAPGTSAVRVGIRVPFGTEARNAPKLAAANSQLIKAEAELRQTVAEIETEQQEAQSALDSADAVYQAAQSRAALASERLALQQKAFSLGELGLAEFMRVRAAAVEARLDLLRARYALSAARAGLNQARGILP
ncbi:MAG: TolC family protein [Rhodoferax sp.]